ncbi:MAG: DUF4974 domain-containing protein [Tannerella sp.]|jgi:ferric-dicitrate binding protein FerR (iron transport regulator)|nr:DUF4974 domain-containing protein [Tannerella sp.]
MTENSHIEELMIRYLTEDINLNELKELEAWIMESPEHKDLFFRLKKISDSSRRSICPETEKEALWQRMLHRISRDITKEREALLPAKNKRLFFYKYVAVALIALSMGWGAGLFMMNKHKPGAAVSTAWHEIRVKKGGRGNTIILSDGSKVTLNAMTTFRYPTDFSETDRIVYLDGEAYFEIAKNEAKPFIVKLKKQDVKVLGTSFNIEAYSDENYSIVTLLSGNVSLESYNEQNELMGKMFLKPNQRAVSDNRSGSVSLENIHTSLAEAWTSGKYKFKDEPLQIIAKRLEKYYDVQVNIENEQLGQIRFTGTFSLDQDIQEVLRILDHEKRYRVNRIKKEIFIVNK